MIPREDKLTRAEYLERESLRRFYNTPTGIAELCREIIVCGALSEITNPDQVIAHNICIRNFERLGLDEEILPGLIQYLLTTDSGKKPVDDALESASTGV